MYNPEKDRVFTAEIQKFGETSIEVKLVSYDDGEPKIQLSRCRLENGETSFLRLGRLTIEEARWAGRTIGELVKAAEAESKES